MKEKKSQLEEQFGIRTSAEATREMGFMLNEELAIESIARKEGKAEGITQTGVAGQHDLEFILKQLEKHFGEPKKAQAFLDEYAAEHPQEAAYLKNKDFDRDPC